VEQGIRIDNIYIYMETHLLVDLAEVLEVDGKVCSEPLPPRLLLVPLLHAYVPAIVIIAQAHSMMS
jgi:hypothetical protein